MLVRLEETNRVPAEPLVQKASLIWTNAIRPAQYPSQRTLQAPQWSIRSKRWTHCPLQHALEGGLGALRLLPLC
jgi:hypothetical protein